MRTVANQIAALAVVLFAGTASAQIQVATSDELEAAIRSVNANPTAAHTIQITDDIALDDFLEPIALSGAGTLTVEALTASGRATISGRDQTGIGPSRTQALSIFFVDEGEVTFQNLTLRDGVARGGDGGAGRAGGGLGAAGALFVDSGADVTIVDVLFQSNTARGGDGGLDVNPNFGGGGGGFHGDGGEISGGGGGFAGDGGGTLGGGGGFMGDGESGDPIIPGQEGDGGGKFLDGDGGAGDNGPNGTGGAGGDFEGGGFGSRGGVGGVYGGGGGGGRNGAGDGGDFGGGGGGGDLAAILDPGDPDLPTDGRGGAGGSGGFGGGGGGSSAGRDGGRGGFGGGDGMSEGRGGAGSSLGGAVFVRNAEDQSGVAAGQLHVQVTQDFTIATGNSLSGASGSGDATQEGRDFYLMDGISLSFDIADTTTGTIESGNGDGGIAGDGGITKAGDGTLVLNGTNTYNGTTNLQAGRLRGSTSSIPGNVSAAMGSVLEFLQSSNASYSAALSGAGTLEKTGTGTLSITGNNASFTGATSIVEGTLSLTTDSLPQTSDITVGGSATLRIDQGSDGDFDRPLQNSGTFEKSGSGRVTLTADQPLFQGEIRVQGGELTIADGIDVESAGVNVGSGGRLSGAGTVGATGGTVDVSGALVPGDSSDVPATFTIDSADLVFAPGSVLEVDVTDAPPASGCVGSGGDADCANVTGGSADLGNAVDGGVLVRVNPTLSTFLQNGEVLDFTIIQTTGGIDQFDPLAVQDDFCFLSTELMENGNSLVLRLEGDIQVDGACTGTQNQRAVGGGLARSADPAVVDPGMEDVLNSLAGLTEDEVAGALDQMSGEGLSSFGTARLAAATQFFGAISERMRDPSPATASSGGSVPYPLSMSGPLMPSLGANASLSGPLTASSVTASMASAGGGRRGPRAASPFTFVSQRGESGLGGWLDGFATFAEIDGDGGGRGATGQSNQSTGSLPLGSNDTDFNLYGTSGGIDWAFADGGLIGAAFGYTRSKTSVSDLTTWGTGDTVQGAVYGAWATDWFYVGGAARYSFTQMDIDRQISYGNIYESVSSDFDGSSISGYVEAGLAAFEWGDWKFQPSASFQYTYMDTEAFNEDQSSTGFALNLQSQSFSSSILNLGVRTYAGFDMDEGYQFIPEFRARWGHEFGDQNRDVAAQFVDSTVSTFSVQGAEIDRDVAVLGAGWSVVGKGNVSLSLDYDATLNQDFVAHTVTLGVLIYW